MPLASHLNKRNRQDVDEDSVHQSLGTMPFWYLGGSMVIAVLLVAITLSVPVYMMGLHPIELAMQAVHEEQSDDQWQRTVDPKFALDGRSFLIEPAAGPLNQAEIQICRRVLAEELSCSR